MSAFLDPKLSRLVAYTPGEQPPDLGRLIKLNTNESPFPPSPKVSEAIGRAQVESLRLYPSLGYPGLKEAAAEVFGIAPGQFCATNGSDEALAFCFHGLCPSGAVFADLTYGFYPVFADMFGVRYEKIPLREDFSIEVDDYRGKRGTVFIANPNAPTGLYLPLCKIRELLLQDPSRLVVVDEAYIDFGGESAAGLLGEHPNLMVIMTFSKSRQLAGGRLALAMASGALIADLELMKNSFNPYSVNNLTLLAGEAALRDKAYFERCRAEVIRVRDDTAQALRARGFTLTDSRANFLFARHPRLDGGEYYRALRERGILVRHLPGERSGAWVRVTVGTAEQMKRFVEATDETLNEV